MRFRGLEVFNVVPNASSWLVDLVMGNEFIWANDVISRVKDAMMLLFELLVFLLIACDGAGNIRIVT